MTTWMSRPGTAVYCNNTLGLLPRPACYQLISRKVLGAQVSNWPFVMLSGNVFVATGRGVNSPKHLDEAWFRDMFALAPWWWPTAQLRTREQCQRQQTSRTDALFLLISAYTLMRLGAWCSLDPSVAHSHGTLLRCNRPGKVVIVFEKFALDGS